MVFNGEKKRLSLGKLEDAMVADPANRGAPRQVYRSFYSGTFISELGVIGYYDN